MENKNMDIVYLTTTPCKIEDLHKCVQNLKVEAIDFEIKNDDIKAWRELYQKHQKPILKQKNFIEIENVKIDLKKKALAKFGNISPESLAKVLLKYKNQIGFKIFDYTLFDGENLTQESAKSPLKISDSIHYPIVGAKSIESVMDILVDGNWVKWYEASLTDQDNWYLEQKHSLNKILN
jgi:hypothetical protein